MISSVAEIALENDSMSALVSSAGATLRSFVDHGVPVLWGTVAGQVTADGRGQVLAPWPNRLDEGAYEFGGVVGRAPWSEPARRNAIHGLVRFLNWEVEERTATSVQFVCPLVAQPAYPFDLRLSITYALTGQGLEVTVNAGNVGEAALPFGIGFHPYLAPGEGGLDVGVLEVPATSHLLLDDRGLPTGSEQLGESPRFAPLEGVMLDDCFTDLDVGSDGRWQVRFHPDGLGGSTVALSADEAFGYVMCYTADTLDPALRRSGMAVEPMTCPPNAFRSGEGTITLVPGAKFSSQWGITRIS